MNKTGTLRFELRNSVLETDSLPISLRSYSEFEIQNHKSEIECVRKDLNLQCPCERQFYRLPAIPNRRLTRIKVSDGNRTRNIRFGRPTLSLLSFAHEKLFGILLNAKCLMLNVEKCVTKKDGKADVQTHLGTQKPSDDSKISFFPTRQSSV